MYGSKEYSFCTSVKGQICIHTMSCILYQGTCTFLCDVLSVFVTVMLPASYTRIKFSVLLTLRSEIFFYQRYVQQISDKICRCVACVCVCVFRWCLAGSFLGEGVGLVGGHTVITEQT